MLVALCAGEDHPQEIVGELSWLMFLKLFSRILKSKMVLSDHKSMLEFLELLLFIAKFPIEVIPLGMFGTPLKGTSSGLYPQHRVGQHMSGQSNH